jgi:AcrR family transcriptional regulator
MTTRDPEATKGRLLAAAMREFSAKGIAGARVDAIAEKAATNKRMLYYYFESKDGLFRQILRRRLIRGFEAIRGATMPRRHDMSSLQEYFIANRDYVRLLMWEALETSPRRPVEEEEGRRELYRQRVESIGAEQAAGVVDRRLDPAQLLLSELAMTIFPAAFPQVTRLVTGFNVTDKEFVEQRLAFFAALADVLAPTPAEAPSDGDGS